MPVKHNNIKYKTYNMFRLSDDSVRVETCSPAVILYVLYLLLLCLTDIFYPLLRKPEGKRPLGRPRRRWVDIRMDLQEVGCGYMDWIGLAQDRDRWRKLVSAVMNLRVP